MARMPIPVLILPPINVYTMIEQYDAAKGAPLVAVAETARGVPLGSGRPEFEHVSTSYTERQNLTMRMSIRRFTRVTNAFSKKLKNHEAAVALHFMHYNFVRVHQTLRCTPAMAAGVSDHVWSTEEIVALLP